MQIYTKELNRYVGKRLQLKRKKMGLSLAGIANLIGVSLQQVQKYESGQSAISTSRLYQLATILDVDFDYFFKEFKAFKRRTGHTPDMIIQQDRSCPLNVLLIEDDEPCVLLTRKAFEASPLDINLHAIYDSTHVLEFLRNTITITSAPFSRPDIILLNLDLPKIDGFSILHEIKHDDALSDIPVIILSGSTRTEDMIACYQEYASGYMCKPLDFELFGKNIEILAQYWGQTVVLPNRQSEMIYNIPRN